MPTSKYSLCFIRSQSLVLANVTFSFLRLLPLYLHQHLFTPAVLIRISSLLQDMLFPNAEIAPPTPDPSEEEVVEMNARLVARLTDAIPCKQIVLKGDQSRFSSTLIIVALVSTSTCPDIRCRSRWSINCGGTDDLAPSRFVYKHAPGHSPSRGSHIDHRSTPCQGRLSPDPTPYDIL